MVRKWLEGAAGLRQETLTQPFTKCTGKRADELIRASLTFLFYHKAPHIKSTINKMNFEPTAMPRQTFIRRFGNSGKGNTKRTSVATMRNRGAYIV